MPHARPTCRFARLLPGVLALLAVPGASVSLDARPLTPEQAPVAASTSQTVDAAIAASGRPATDKARDAVRKPAAMLLFSGIQPGDRVADLIPGGGYFTRLFSGVVGPTGKVYAVIPTETLAQMPKAADATKAVAADPAFANVAPVVTPTAALTLPEPVDIVWTAQNYHDIYNGAGADQARRLNEAVFRALKPGGLYVVIDHSAAPGASPEDQRALHRIAPAIVRAQVEAAGFLFAGESRALANPEDPRTEGVFAPAIRGHTDQFALKFRKPLA